MAKCNVIIMRGYKVEYGAIETSRDFTDGQSSRMVRYRVMKDGVEVMTEFTDNRLLTPYHIADRFVAWHEREVGITNQSEVSYNG